MVTVIINTYNERPEVLKKAIDSYKNQTYENVQIIVSTVEGDPSIEWVKQNADYCLSVLPLSEHPGKSPAGAYAQINNALKLISPASHWLCYASGNDTAKPHKILSEIAMCMSHKKEVCYSAFSLTDENGKKISDQFFPSYDYQKHLAGNFVSDCSLISMRLVKKYLPYKIEFGNFAHWDSWLRMYEGEGDIFVYNHLPTWNYYQNSNDMHRLRMNDPEKRSKYIESQKEFIKNRLK